MLQVQMTLLLILFHFCSSHFLLPNNHSIEAPAWEKMCTFLSCMYVHKQHVTLCKMHKRVQHASANIFHSILCQLFYFETIVLILLFKWLYCNKPFSFWWTFSLPPVFTITSHLPGNMAVCMSIHTCVGISPGHTAGGGATGCRMCMTSALLNIADSFSPKRLH